MIALLAVCGIVALTQGPVTVDLPRNLLEVQQDNWVYSVFFVERTMTVEVKDFPDTTGIEFIVWETSRRHTSTNAEKVERTESFDYRYYFATDKDIVIFDRRANTPVWYGIAVGVTAIAMVVFYFMVKKKKTKPMGESAQGQYQYPGN